MSTLIHMTRLRFWLWVGSALFLGFVLGAFSLLALISVLSSMISYAQVG